MVLPNYWHFYEHLFLRVLSTTGSDLPIFGTDYLESDHFRQLLKIMNELPKVGTFVHFTPKIIQKYANMW